MEKRGCIWLVSLLSCNTYTPSTQQRSVIRLDSERRHLPNSFSPMQHTKPSSFQLSFSKKSNSIIVSILHSSLWLSRKPSVPPRKPPAPSCDRFPSASIAFVLYHSRTRISLIGLCLSICRQSLDFNNLPASNSVRGLLLLTPVRRTILSFEGIQLHVQGRQSD